MMHDLPVTQDLVLIGGGHTHALVLKSWAMAPLPGVRLTLIDPDPTAAYSGMLPGFVAGHYTRDDLDIDLVRLARMAGARLMRARATGIDRIRRLVLVPDRPPVAYDACSIDIGITSDMPGLTGFSDHAVPAKPLGPFAARWTDFLADADAPSVAVIGGGIAGAELAMAMAHRLRDRPATVTLVDRGRVGKELNQTARRKLLSALDATGVIRREGAEVSGISASGIELADGTDVRAEFVTGAAGARPYLWLGDIGIDLHDGFVAVGPTLQSTDPAIFAVGDCAHLGHAPRPKAGVYAVREAPVLTYNLAAFLSDRPLRRYRPQSDYLKLISLGGMSALAEKFGTALSGPLMWRWKDRIDRKFMDQFKALKPMVTDLPPAVARGVPEELGSGPPCGGCGAKAGRGALSAALGPGIGDDAAILQVGEARQVISTDHLRAVTEDPYVMAQIAAVHALGDVWAMGAEPQAALATIILPRMSSELQARTLTEVMAGARSVFDGVPVVGGHSSLGSEMTIGFTVTGLCTRDPVTLTGALPGDALILTKPIGSGTVLAAEMRGVARGADVMSTLSTMLESQGRASQRLGTAHAMTDITGFGLAGHLMNICEASGVAAEIDMASVPVMPGAAELSQAGIRSSLYEANRSALPDVDLPPLMFDPQTAGGLLAAVPEDVADPILSDLNEAGYPLARRIGRIVAGPPGVTVS